MQVQSLGQLDSLEEEMATHSSILAWKIPCTEDPGRLQSAGLQSQTWLSMHRARTHACTHTHTHFEGWDSLCYLMKWTVKDYLVNYTGLLLFEILQYHMKLNPGASFCQVYIQHKEQHFNCSASSSSDSALFSLGCKCSCHIYDHQWSRWQLPNWPWIWRSDSYQETGQRTSFQIFLACSCGWWPSVLGYENKYYCQWCEWPHPQVLQACVLFRHPRRHNPR